MKTLSNQLAWLQIKTQISANKITTPKTWCKMNSKLVSPWQISTRIRFQIQILLGGRPKIFGRKMSQMKLNLAKNGTQSNSLIGSKILTYKFSIFNSKKPKMISKLKVYLRLWWLIILTKDRCSGLPISILGLDPRKCTMIPQQIA